MKELIGSRLGLYLLGLPPVEREELRNLAIAILRKTEKERNDENEKND